MLATQLTLEITNGSRSFSNSIMVYRINALDTGVEVTIAGEEYNDGEIYRISSNSTFDTGSGATARTLKLDAKAVTEDGTAASIPDVFFAIDESMQDIATVDGKGNITFKDKAYTSADSPLIVKVWSTNSKDTPTEVKFDVYYATVESAIQTVNAINTEWAKHFSNANSSSHFNGDWGSTSEKTYNFSGFYFKNAVNSISDGEAFGTITNASVSLSNDSENVLVVNSNGNIDFSLYDRWDGRWTVVGTEDVKTISCNSQSLTVTLPFNQGTAIITYENIRVKDDSGNNTRGGYYSVDFSSDILGIDGVNLDRTGDNKINDATEAANITKLIYG